ncbi:MAG: hypothetical protein QOC65_1572 [Sphingomonadales bacterium]|nr:hypothetical protein [Sphingomonadales bacterium]
MPRLAFDTLAFVKRLSAAGMNARQAEAMAEALTEHAFTDLATKSDLKDLELRLTLRFGAMLAASTALTVGILGIMGGS